MSVARHLRCQAERLTPLGLHLHLELPVFGLERLIAYHASRLHFLMHLGLLLLVVSVLDWVASHAVQD